MREVAANKPFEWTGRHWLYAAPPKPPCLPLKGSILGGGAKSTQNKDIKKALELNRLFKEFSQ
ncbi:MAG: hypothetical protein ACK583_10300 [Cyanobacteriota bacterium]|jgi:hypothetical protein